MRKSRANPNGTATYPLHRGLAACAAVCALQRFLRIPHVDATASLRGKPRICAFSVLFPFFCNRP
ncbi:hypothetical protein WM40_04055 [Robbsia andropogonis]|uniref:Uncharacterized protein n=1 Tax=Robbsia andropogonis TaxID=28092 RepID=A0A0F5K3F9_9BURK|nr:hypothetical protein WM40_04055 [Robbsia andropogonis]